MAGKSDYLENKLLDHTLKNTAYTSPTTVYLALYTANPADSGGGTEVSGGSYARQSVAFNSAASGATANTSDITFPVATANWGTITSVGIFDASSAGNLLYWNPITSVTINNTEQLKFLAGEIDITED